MTLFEILHNPAVVMVDLYDHTATPRQLKKQIEEIDREIRDLFRAGEVIPSILPERRSHLLAILRTMVRQERREAR